jgi:ubiquinone/menaquinone biosynthesis C-methylase UbiE
VSADQVGKAMGYSDEELGHVPEDSNLGLGCGNPTALASLAEGETVLDLGSGAGFDCFLAAEKVGPTGQVIGVDTTPDMVAKARENAARGGFDNVEFRLGEIEALPVADSSVDVIISNCVLNLSPARDRVFQEALRALKPGGRFLISDLISDVPPPDFVQGSMDSLVGCLPVLRDEYLGGLRDAGFQEVEIAEEKAYPVDMVTTDPRVQEFLAQHSERVGEVVKFIRSVRSASISGKKG